MIQTAITEKLGSHTIACFPNVQSRFLSQQDFYKQRIGEKPFCAKEGPNIKVYTLSSWQKESYEHLKHSMGKEFSDFPKPTQDVQFEEHDRPSGCVQVFGALLDKWALTKKEGTLLLGYENEKDASDFLSGLKRLQTRDAKDRVRYLFKIHSALHRLFENSQVEKDWLREPNDEYLGGKSPLDILMEGSMENLLLVKQFVERISGR